MIHLGNITKVKGNIAPVVDCVIGGSPCQDLSLAGKRAGLAGARSGLYMEQIRIIKEMREYDRVCGRSGIDIRPRYMVWENVPGAFSTNKGQDFAAVLEEAIRIAEPEAPSVFVPEKGWPTSGCLYDEMGNWSVAWRILDAQFWGTSNKPLPQRRRRIALVADFGGLSAPEILFVRKSVSGDIEPGEPKRKETAGYAGEGSGGASYAIQGSMIGRADQNGPQGDGVNEDVSFTLNTTDRHAAVYGISPYHSNCMKSDNPHSGYYEAETSGSLDAMNCGYPGCNQGGMAVVQPVAYGVTTKGNGDAFISEERHTSLSAGGGQAGQGYPCAMTPVTFEPGIAKREGGHIYDGVSGTLRANAGANQMAVAYSIENHPADSRVDIDESGKVQTLTSRMGIDGGNVPMVIEAVGINGDIAGTLDGSYYKGCGMREGKERDVVYQPVSCFQNTGVDWWNESDVGATPRTPCGGGATKANLVVAGVDCRNATKYPEMTGTIQSKPGGGFSLNCNQVVRVKHLVRRLTPLECERLQGFPDGWTDIGEWVDSKGKKHKEADSSRYKALGNSIALPPWKWVLKRLCACYERDATMASLFDGIGGFPLIWEQLNGKGSCLWASEIEEFPIAVTKVRFCK